MEIINLKVNGITNPVGFNYDRLFVSWKVIDTIAKKQRNVLVEVSDTFDFRNIVAQVEGSDLNSRETEIIFTQQPYTTYYWRVTVEADNGEKARSKTATFETAKMDEPWMAKWIAPRGEDAFHVVVFRRFRKKTEIKRARLYVCGLGVFEAYINGKKAGNDFLAPFINDYVECYQYMTYDVTDSMYEMDENIIEISLGKGWYMGTFGLDMKDKFFGSKMKAIAELRLEYVDGSTETIVTDEDWLYKGSDIEESGIYFGEIINRQLWRNRDNSDKPVEVTEGPGRLVPRYSLPLIAKEELHAKEIIKTPAGETVIDFGQNHAGYMEFVADFPAGTRVKFECAEILQNGNFYHDNYREAESIFEYVSDGRKEIVRPHFTYFGYRYLKVTGWPGELKKDDVVAKVVYSDMDRTGFIQTSNDKINRLYKNCIWGQKSNFVDIPTDCPQRNERLGWTGDAQIFTTTASYNMDTRAFYNKFFKDLRSEQVRENGAIANYIPSMGPTIKSASVWGDVATFSPDSVYHMFGTLGQMASYYPMMKDWVEYLYRIDKGAGDKRQILNWFQFGDWLALDGLSQQSFKGATDDDYIGTVYYYHSTKITGEMAKRLGLLEDAEKYHKLSSEIKSVILNEYFSPTGRFVLDTQASYIIALHFGLFIDKQRLVDQFKKRLERDCFEIKCGFVGAPLLCETLCQCGLSEIAYKFLFREEFPSWLYCVNLGATTIWERWNSLLPNGVCSGTGMNSFNHYSYGAVVQFFYAYIAGIRPLEPGFAKAIISPEPSMRFHYFNCTFDSASGKYVSNWKIEEDGNFHMHVEIPFNCEAVVKLPRYQGQKIIGSEGIQVDESGTVHLQTGSYDFSYLPCKDFRNIYTSETLLKELIDDVEAMEIIKENLPQIYSMIMGGDEEYLHTTLGNLGEVFYAKIYPELAKRITRTIEKIYSLCRW